MTLDEALKFFGSGYKICMALDLKSQNYTRWKKQGYIPLAQQSRIQSLTEGALKADYDKSFVSAKKFELKKEGV
jgi:hypothetical protein